MKKTLALMLIVAVAFAAGCLFDRWYHLGHRHEQMQATGYHCPMHPQVKSDHPGDCPICGMKLVPDEAASSAAPSGRILYYQDPQQPGYHSDKPGLNPQTGNTLVPVYAAASAPSVMIPTEKQQWIGLKTGVAEIRSAVEKVRAPGRVAADETRIVHVQTRNEGWIEKVFVDFTGRLVHKGEPMLTLYSPELTASQQEYLLARRARTTLEHSMVPGVGHSSDSLAEAARARLAHHWGMDEAAIAELERTGKPQAGITVRAPADGFVLSRNAFAGEMVKPGMELYSLADLSQVWIIADILESDAAKVRLGMSAVVEPSYAPQRRLVARVTQILPQMDAQTRTLKVRLDVANADFTLKPELFVNVEFGFASQPRVSVPEDAVIDLGDSQVVYMDLGEGRFEPRRVEVGERSDGRVEVLRGLAKGERIVVGGAFLVDSESRIRSGAQ